MELVDGGNPGHVQLSQRSSQRAHLRVVGRDNKDVVRPQGTSLTFGVRPRGVGLEQRARDGNDGVHFFGGMGLIALVRHLHQEEPRTGERRGAPDALTLKIGGRQQTTFVVRLRSERADGWVQSVRPVQKQTLFGA